MKRKQIFVAAVWLAAFGLWTAAVQLVDVQAIGPQGSAVGFASVNGFVHRLTGVHMALYVATDWLSLVPLGLAAGFGLLGLCQWVKRRRLRLVDRDLFALGGFYLAVIAAYALFEKAVVNYRPVLIEGVLEASYPSSTTLLVLCVMVTAVMQMKKRIRKNKIRQMVCAGCTVFAALMVAGRLLSGVHWITDIAGGILLSVGLVLLYRAAAE